MKRLAVYLEGGGNTAQEKADLRKGFELLFQVQRKAIFDKGGRLDFIPSGGRDMVYKRFAAAFRKPGQVIMVILLVDSEEAVAGEIKGKPEVNAETRKHHLIKRDNRDLAGVPAEIIHLMVQCMESWIVADSDALADFYGKWFHARSLPSRNNLEDEPKLEVYEKLARATEKTSKGVYGKIKHASRLLALIDRDKTGKRCPRFKTLIEWLDERIAEV